MLNRILALTLFTTLLTFNTQAQSLVDQVEEAGIGWLLGSWEGTTDDGDTISTSFKWDLDKKIIITESTNPRWSTKAMTGIDPESGRAALVGYSTRGSLMKGRWDGGDGKAVLKLKITTKDSDDMNVGIRYSKAGDQAMKLEFFELDGGDLVEPARWSTEFKKKK